MSYVFQQPEHQLFEESVQSELEFALDNYKITKELWPRLISDSLISCGLSTSFLNRHPLGAERWTKEEVSNCIGTGLPAEIINS